MKRRLTLILLALMVFALLPDIVQSQDNVKYINNLMIGQRPWIDVTHPTYGAIPDDGLDDTAAIQAAINAAAVNVETYGALYRQTAKVYFPQGNYAIASGSTLRLKRAVELVGAGKSLTWITHGGGNVPLFDTDPGSTYNYEWSISNMTLTGAGATSTYGIYANNCSRDNYLKHVVIRNFNVNLYFTDSWSFNIFACDFYSPLTDNIQWYNATDVAIKDSRIWGAENGHNLYITKSASYQTVNFVLDHCLISISGKAQVYLYDVFDAKILNTSFERGNSEDNDWADIHWEESVSPGGVSRMLYVSGVLASSSNAGASTRWLYANGGDVTVVGSKVYSSGVGGGVFEYAVELGASVDSYTEVGSEIEGDTAKFLIASAATPVSVVAPIQTTTISTDTDALDVSGDVRIVYVYTTDGNVTVGGIVGGQKNQTIKFVKTTSSNNLVIEHNEDTGNQKMYLAAAGDKTIAAFGGAILTFNGSGWFEATD